AVFTAGSAIGLVTLSHILGYVLKHFKHITTAAIIGFITGSLGVVWPWKNAIYMLDQAGNTILDSNGDKIIMNYNRYWPSIYEPETWWAFAFVILGVIVLMALEWYGKNKRNKA
ncbi:MAG: DUF368 domain-containing protein, partial [Eudoraea sp.]|nr:DUF368 domain-containing protein [Eudoraea sp.]